MTNKSYIFTTVKEIADQLSVEQIDDFLIDFGLWLRFIKTGKSNSKEFDGLAGTMFDLVKTFAKLTGEKAPDTIVDTTRFGWTDDGEHYPKKATMKTPEHTIEFTIPKPKEEQQK